MLGMPPQRAVSQRAGATGLKRRSGKLAAILLLILPLILVVHDSLTQPSAQFLTQPVLNLFEGYRAHISPHLGGVIRCRFQPTCSRYGLDSVRKYGGLRGSGRALWRVIRCNPLTRQGTIDLP